MAAGKTAAAPAVMAAFKAWTFRLQFKTDHGPEVMRYCGNYSYHTGVPAYQEEEEEEEKKTRRTRDPLFSYFCLLLAQLWTPQ